MKKRKLFGLAMLAVLLFSVGSGASVVAAPAATSYQIYMELDGICGESKLQQFPNWIELTGVEFSAGNPVAPTSQSTGGGVKAGKAQLKNFTVSKAYDCSSIPLFTASLSAKHIKDGQIVFVKPGTSQPLTVLKIEMTGVTVSEIQFNNMTETISIQAASLQFSYIGVDDQGKVKPPVKGSWNFQANNVQ